MYLLLIAILYVINLAGTVRDDFSGRVAASFSVASVIVYRGTMDFGRETLQRIEARSPNLPPLQFLLPQKEISIVHGDFHRAKVIEDHGDWQIIEFYYSNTHNSTSRYKAYADRIEPISYLVTFSIGHMMLLIILVVPIYLLALLVTFVRNGRSRKMTAE